MPKPRSYSAGRRKTSSEPSSVVRVYERPDLPGYFMTMAWDVTDSGRPHEEKLPGHLTWEQACALADELAAKRRVRVLGGIEEEERQKRAGVTLEYVYGEYLKSAEASEWSDKHRADHERGQAFWLGSLGKGTVVTDLSKARVEKAAKDARKDAGYSSRWEKRKLALLRAVVRWGQRKADLYDVNPLDGLEMPDYEPDTDDLIYSEGDTLKLLRPHPEIDWRVTLMANIAVDHGRRNTAIRMLTVHDVIQDGDAVELRFRKEFDKGSRTATRKVSVRTAELVRFALAECRVLDSEWLFPGGRLDYDDPRDAPWSKESALKGLHRAEAVLDIETVPNRGYHALKRRSVTTGIETFDVGLVGDMTGNRDHRLLMTVYRKQSRRRLEGYADTLRDRLEDGESTHESTRAGSPDSGDPPEAAESLGFEGLARVDSNHHRRFQRPADSEHKGAEDGAE